MKLQIPDYTRARVLVVGDIMLDRYWHGDTSRISPEAPVPVVHVGGAEERPGGAGNVALNIAALGGHVTLVGMAGYDEAADSLERLMNQASVDCRFVRVEGQPTITKLRILSRHQQLIRLDFEGGFAAADHQALGSTFERALDQADVVVLSDYGKGTLKPIRELIRLARERGLPVLVDPKSNDFADYHGATLVTPNLREFEAVVGPVGDDEELLVQRGMELMARHALEGLLITRSERGMTLLRTGEEPLHLPTRARDVFDVTGAGDTVISVLAASMAAGASEPQATVFANTAAGVVVGKVGTATVSVAEIRRALQEDENALRGVMTEEQLLETVEDARAHGERIVMTNGCFDILHAGHVAYLNQARSLGDRLIVAVNTDESVRRLKGETRPVNPVEHRMTVLAALQAVDWVVPFGEDTPERLICAVNPDFLVKGGDNDPDKIPGNRCVREAGGEVVVLSYIEGVSTTGTIARIQSRPRED
ncbi:MAG: bifunctional D-glycero-beta-D-manno-heptose-7-phosphate kinase/D-glycero-beta-D-manno-heptose 1-phosphate adenylyltransferase HldE [Gammaproteobacteria bacterium]